MAEKQSVLEVNMQHGDWSRWFGHAAVANDVKKQKWLIFPNPTGRSIRDQNSEAVYPPDCYFLAKKPATSPTSVFQPVIQTSEPNTNRISASLDGFDIKSPSMLTEPDLAAIATMLINTLAGKLNTAGHSFPFQKQPCDLSWVPEPLLSTGTPKLKIAIPYRAARLKESTESPPTRATTR